MCKCVAAKVGRLSANLGRSQLGNDYICVLVLYYLPSNEWKIWICQRDIIGLFWLTSM